MTAQPMNRAVWREPVVLAASGLFLLNGLGYAALASRLPELQERYGLSDSQMGFARVGFVVGLTATMFVAPQVVRRIGAARVAPIAAGLYLAGIGLAGTGIGLWATIGWLLVAGTFNALLDIGQNVLAVRLEKVRMAAVSDTRENSLLSPMEGLQAVGGTLGAGFGLVTAGRIPLLQSFVTLAAVGFLGAATVFVILRRFPTSTAPADEGSTGQRYEPVQRKEQTAPLLARIRAAYPSDLRWLTAMSFSALLLEGMLTNWLAILAVHSGASLTSATLALTVFIGSICVGRMAFGPLSRYLDRVWSARISGLLVIVGVAGIVTHSQSGAAALAAASVAAGLGLANLHPFCTGSVGHGVAPGDEEHALGKLNRVAYIGIALEGMLIGALAAVVGLAVAMAAIGLLAILFVVKAPLFTTQDTVLTK
ncbi:MFS transporter [Nocardia sp. NPDC056541]|uniref:MFS transporter n=1 Tax=Nocardia sp. NPDC056541 TaxID=3345860 RepID=UPI00366E0EA7